MRPPCSLAAYGINPLNPPSSQARVPNTLLPAALLLQFYVTPCSLAADGINPEAQLKIIPVAVSKGQLMHGQQLQLGGRYQNLQWSQTDLETSSASSMSSAPCTHLPVPHMQL